MGIWLMASPQTAKVAVVGSGGGGSSGTAGPSGAGGGSGSSRGGGTDASVPAGRVPPQALRSSARQSRRIGICRFMEGPPCLVVFRPDYKPFRRALSMKRGALPLCLPFCRFFGVHGGKLKPHPVGDLGQATIKGITHTSFEPLNLAAPSWRWEKEFFGKALK